jgi:hypothetical protein
MFAALAVAPTTAPDSGLAAAIIFAAAVTALVALGLMLLGLHRSARLTITHGLATGALALGVIGVAVLGIVASSPEPAQANSDHTPTILISDTDDDGAVDGEDIQLPTLSTD